MVACIDVFKNHTHTIQSVIVVLMLASVYKYVNFVEFAVMYAPTKEKGKQSGLFYWNQSTNAVSLEHNLYRGCII